MTNAQRPATVGLLSTAIVAGSILVAGCGNPVDCHSHPMTDATIPVATLPDPTDGGSGDGGTQQLVEGCQTMQSDCLKLCQRVIGPDYQTYAILTCELITADGGLALHVVYSGYCAA